jgi:protein transport protein SEC24
VTGVQVKAHYGNFLERSTSEVDFAVIDADKSVYVSLDYTSALDDFGSLTLDTITSFIGQKDKSLHSPPAKQSLSTQKQAYFQSALLYTTVAGERRVRVCNLSVPVVSLAGNVFRYGDYEGVIGALAKTGKSQLFYVFLCSGF